MSEIYDAICEAIATVPSWVYYMFAVGLLLSTTMSIVKCLCLGYGRGRSRGTTQEKMVDSSPIPCDIHDDCTDCAFSGTSYCWKVMRHE